MGQRIVVPVRWERLFDDLEAQLEAAEAAELSAEIADRERREAASIALRDRLRASVGQPLTAHLPGGVVLRGELLDCGADWLLLQDGRTEALVPLPAILGVTGPGARTAAPDDSPVARRLDLRWALRALSRSRSGVRLTLVDASVLSGTVDRVGLDHLDLAEHQPGEARRAGAVRAVRLVPLAALAVVHRS